MLLFWIRVFGLEMDLDATIMGRNQVEPFCTRASRIRLYVAEALRRAKILLIFSSNVFITLPPPDPGGVGVVDAPDPELLSRSVPAVACWRMSQIRSRFFTQNCVFCS